MATQMLVISPVLSLVSAMPIQDVGKAYNELKKGEPAIERLFQLSSFKPKGLGTSNGKEGAEYFVDLDKHKKDFVWADDADGAGI